MTEQITIAIIGGGLGGCTLANALRHHPNINYHVFEARDSFVQPGSAVGLLQNTTAALSAMRLPVDEMYRDASAFVSGASRCLIGVGDHKGESIIQVPAGHVNVTRERWLERLLKDLPKAQLHCNKKLISLEEPDAPNMQTMLRFHDGTTFQADGVIAFDGVHSFVRRYILSGEPEEIVRPVFGGCWDARATVPIEQAACFKGNEFFDPHAPDKVALVGEGAFLLCCLSEDGNRYCIIASAVANSEMTKAPSKQTLTRDMLQDAFNCWDPELRETVISLLMSEGSGGQTIWPQWHSAAASTFFRGRVCMMGDAAHAVSPFMGLGAGMATEDCAVMSALLGSITTPADLPAAFEAFDCTRRERTNRVVENGKLASKLFTGQLGLDPSRLSALAPSKWWSDVVAIDMDQHIRGAVDDFRRRQNCSLKDNLVAAA